MNPGSIVRCRNRDWVLLPAEADDVWALRPLTGTTDDIVVVHRGLSNLIPTERVSPAAFPLPSPEDVSDATSARLLWQATRLTLRDSATPFRSLGRISIRPRTYQFVPLLMALRLDPVRLFIADDVGVGKTVESLLIARELLDRGEIRRFCVLCPPYLCDQWARALAQQFNLEPVVIRSGTVAQLERQTPIGRSIYEHFSIQVASIDFAKTDRNRHQFLQFCPELVIVDEVHGAADSSGRGAQQERHALLREIADKPDRHLILLTATPHSGIEDAFRSLLGLLHPEFCGWDLANLDDAQRIELAKHFVQRTRRDIEQTWEANECFPKRLTADETYELSAPYRALFNQTFNFCSEIVRSGENIEEYKRRVRYWGALALLRCVMSSPAAAVAALAKRIGASVVESERRDHGRFVMESSDDRGEDESPTPPITEMERELGDAERRQLREIARLAEQVEGSADDTKLQGAIEIARTLLEEGFHPIFWCRYVATAEYLGKALECALNPDASSVGVQVLVITGRTADETQRQAELQRLAEDRPRVLVATDCLSEGLDLQEKFSAVVHYDLPWNPNRLEQREGRVDRYGQPSKQVKAIRYFGRDNPVDGAVIEVLLDKAREIHRTLGTHVPVPEESESVTQAVLEALFFRHGYRAHPEQLLLDLGLPQVTSLHRRWERDAERERVNRTRFAQRALKPEEVQRELDAVDAVLGDPDEVRDFVLSAAQQVGLTIRPDPRNGAVYRVSTSSEALVGVPEPIRFALDDHLSRRVFTSTRDDSWTSEGGPRSQAARPQHWCISFRSPTPRGAEYLGRNHPFVAVLARYLFEDALSSRPTEATVSRCGALRTRAVQELTTLLLLRVRYLVERPEVRPLLSEEVVVLGFVGTDARNAAWLASNKEALRLLREARPDANLPLEEKKELLRAALEQIREWPADPDGWMDVPGVQRNVREMLVLRARELTEAHKRIRQAVSMRVRGLEVRPQFPPDLLGILVLQPVVRT